MSSSIFGPITDSVTVNATTVSAAVVLRSVSQDNVARIVNDGPNSAYIAFGTSSVAATANSLLILPGQTEYLFVPTASTYVAAIAPDGSAAVNVALGNQD